MLGTAVFETEPWGNSTDYNPANGVSAGVIKLIFSKNDERPGAFSPSPQKLIVTANFQ